MFFNGQPKNYFYLVVIVRQIIYAEEEIEITL